LIDGLVNYPVINTVVINWLNNVID
jgi:hypothetical protein